MSLVISDQALVKQYIAGDESSLEKLIVRHRDRVYGAIYNFTKDVYLTEDLFQEVFIKVVNKLRRESTTKKVSFFLGYCVWLTIFVLIIIERRSVRYPL